MGVAESVKLPPSIYGLVPTSGDTARDQVRPVEPTEHESLGRRLPHANKKPSENCQIKDAARMMMTMRRTPSVLFGQSLGMDDIATAPTLVRS
jgi:hypothetical protein